MNTEKSINEEKGNAVLPLVSQRSELLFGFLEYLKSIEALKHTETWQLKTYVDNYEAKL